MQVSARKTTLLKDIAKSSVVLGRVTRATYSSAMLSWARGGEMILQA
jgi:hypothetical protein